ncbi:arginine decarboxylase, putative [Babesia ovata]|uniref:Arginine decarboxylase, putative n=1 Tax=Babesia ovata TaxID=189622 RepID=A0A2H6KDD5_9APIC|nr:arginine decarboxylase, putative [Babesia ovata]GBE61001.1 arginine decarboxylase, putative [Babesia ovata]
MDDRGVADGPLEREVVDSTAAHPVRCQGKHCGENPRDHYKSARPLRVLAAARQATDLSSQTCTPVSRRGHGRT